MTSLLHLRPVKEKEHVYLNHPLHHNVLYTGYVILPLLLCWHHALTDKLAFKQPYLFVITHFNIKYLVAS